MTRFGRRDESLPDLIAEAGLAALEDAGIERPDALVVAAMNPEEFTGAGNYASLINTYLGLSDVPALRVETATSSGVGRLRRILRHRSGHPSKRARGRRGEDEPHTHPARVGNHRALRRSPRAYLWHDHARAGRPHHPGGHAQPRPHLEGDVAGGGEEPRERGAQSARPLPGDRHPRYGDGESPRRRSPAPLPLLSHLRRRRRSPPPHRPLVRA